MNEVKLERICAFSIVRRNENIIAVHIAAPSADGMLLTRVPQGGDLETLCAALRSGGHTPRVSHLTDQREPTLFCEPPRLTSQLPPLSGPLPRLAHEKRMRQYKINSESVFLPHDRIPSGLQEHFHGFDVRQAFNLSGADEVLWIRDPTYRMWWPYTLTAAESALLRSDQIAKLGASDLETLASIHFLLPQENRHTLVNESSRIASRETSSYVGLYQILNPWQRLAVARFFDLQLEMGLLRKGDPQTPHRFWTHNDAISRYIQLQTLVAVQELTGKNWEPTFTSFLAYEFPADLRRHKDREQAALTVSVLVDYRVNDMPSGDRWDIFIEQASGTFERVLVGLGNAVAFEGKERAHSRNAISEGHKSRSICFHYAKPGFTGKRF